MCNCELVIVEIGKSFSYFPKPHLDDTENKLANIKDTIGLGHNKLFGLLFTFPYPRVKKLCYKCRSEGSYILSLSDFSLSP